MFRRSCRLDFGKALQISHRSAAQQATAQSPSALSCPNASKPCIPDMCALDPDCPQPKVVIVGAGLAGLSAAHRLITCGLKRVTILEAQSRPGGRIYTKKFGDVPVDLGATWINGACTGNPVFTLACQDGAIQSPMVRSSRYWDNSCFDSRGHYIKPKVYHAAILLFDDMVSSARRKYRAVPENVSLWAFFKEQIKEAVALFPSVDRRAAEKVLYGLTNEVRHSLGTELECIPLARYGRTKPYPGGVVAVQSGMSRILNPLLKVIGEKRIKYNKVAVKISWKPIGPSKPRATVLSSDGQGEDADYVIVAVPLGVLKAAHEQIFDPPLPQEKVASINALGFGHVSTIVLKYDKPFWIKGEGYIRLCWSKEELEDRKHWTNSVNLIEEIPTTNDFLHFFVSGYGALQVECLKDCDVANDVTGLLRRFLGNSTIPMPSAVFRTKWKSNNFIGGATTYLGTEAKESDIAKLARPIPDIGVQRAPIVYFAGDACTVRKAGMPAARLSGITEAEKILNLTKCFCGPPPPPLSFSC